MGIKNKVKRGVTKNTLTNSNINRSAYMAKAKVIENTIEKKEKTKINRIKLSEEYKKFREEDRKAYSKSYVNDNSNINQNNNPLLIKSKNLNTNKINKSNVSSQIKNNVTRVEPSNIVKKEILGKSNSRIKTARVDNADNDVGLDSRLVFKTIKEKEIKNIKKSKLYSINQKNPKPNKLNGDYLIGGVGLSTIIKDNINSGDATEDIGVKSVLESKERIDNAILLRKHIKDRLQKKGIQTKKKRNLSKRINTINENVVEKGVKTKRKTKIIEDTIDKKEKLSKSKVVKKGKKLVEFTFKKLAESKVGIGLAIAIAIVLILSAFTTLNNSVSSSTTFTILTTDKQNEEYLKYYNKLKKDLEDEIKSLIEESNNKYDDIEIYGLNPNGKLYDLDFTEWLAILTVKIEQNFKLSHMEYGFLKEIFDLLIFYDTNVKTYTKVDEEGNTEIIRHLIITVNYMTYNDIKHDIGFDKEQLEWVERLIEDDSLKDRIDDIPTNNEYRDSTGKLTDEEIEKYGGKMLHPTNRVGYISSQYGYRIHPITGERKFHSGIDIAGNDKAPIYAVRDGTIIHSGNMGGYGLTVMIRHDNGVVTLYAHCSSLSVRVGQKVEKGEHISNVGTTGASTGPHLHFEIRINGNPVNPNNFL